MEKPLYVMLESLDHPDKDEYMPLIKKISKNYKNKTFRELIECMVDVNGDKYNQPCNAQEVDVANHIRNTLNKPNTISDFLDLYSSSKDEPPLEIDVSLDDKVSDYIDSILKEIKDGEIGYNLIELNISYTCICRGRIRKHWSVHHI